VSWPTPQDYNEAVQNPQQSFCDAELMRGSPELTSLGLPRPITGNFASVYRLHCGRRDWAVRCFWREYADMADRYKAIADHLDASKLPYTVAFEYLPQGIRVRGQWYPILKMEWVEGELLNEFIEKHLADAAALRPLAERWLQMMCALEAASVAHGDLQHGNVLIVNGQLKLVDYDGMYVPALAGRTSHELGHQNYQHPKRSALDFGPHIDHFSAWIIYVSLLAVSSRPDAWTQANGGDECLLLRKGDLELPAHSPILASLQQSGDEHLRRTVAHVQTYLTLAPRQIPPISSLTNPPSDSENNPRRRFAALVRGTTARSAAIPSRAAVPAPAWLTDMMAPTTDQSVVFDSLPTLPRACAGLACATFVASILAVMVSFRALIPASAIITLVIATFNVLLTIVFFGQDARVVEKRALAKRRSYHLQQLRSIQRRDRSLEAQKAAARAAHDRKMVSLAERKATVKERDTQDREAAQMLSHSQLAIMDERLEQLEKAERDALATALKLERERSMSSALKQRSLWTAHISGLDRGAKVQLWLAGVRTAHDVGSSHVGALKRMGRERAASLLMWRLGIEREVSNSLPRRLSTASRTATTAQFESQRRRLLTDRASVEARGKDLLDTIGRHWGRTCARVDAEVLHVAEDYSDECRRLQSMEAGQRGDEPVHSWQLQQIDRELARYESISLSRYFLALVRGPNGGLSWGRERPG
jgi:hypothetical protein